MTSELTSGRGLDRPTARADLRPWLLPKICHTGDHVGIIEEGTGDLVVLGISGISGAPARRIPIGFDAQLRCHHGWITARRATTTEPGTLAAWCSTRFLSRSDPCDRAGQGPFGLSDPPARSTELGSFELDPSGGLVVRGADGRSQPITIFTSDG